MIENKILKKNLKSFIAFIVFLYFSIHQFVYSFSLGANWDENNTVQSSGRYIQKYIYLLTNSKPEEMSYVSGEFYGEIIKLPIHLLTRFENINFLFMKYVNKIFSGTIQNVIDAQFVLRHIFFNLYVLICLIFIYQKLKKLSDENIALWFLILLVLMPSFIGHSIFNPTDTPFALHIFIASLLFIEKLIYNETQSFPDLIIVGFWFGVSFLTRINAIAFLGALSLFLLINNLNKINLRSFFKNNIIIYFSALFMWLLLTPGMLLYPIKWLETLIWFQFNQDWAGYNLVNGTKYYSLDASLLYLPKVFFYKLPLAHILLIFYGGYLYFRKKVSSQLFSYCCFFILYFIAVFSIYQPLVLDYLRHYQFLLPFIALISSFSFNELTKKININLMATVLILYLVFTQFNLGPYKYIYLNELVDEAQISTECTETVDYNGCGLWQSDYYGLSGKEMVKKIEARNIENIYFCDPNHTYSYFLSEELNWKNNNGTPDFDDYSFWDQYKYIYNIDHLNEYLSSGQTKFYMTAIHRPLANTCKFDRITNMSNNLDCEIVDTVSTKIRLTNVNLNYLYLCNF